MKETVEIIWFKKDLRVSDHACLANISNDIPSIWVYFFESDLISQDDFSDFHMQFIVSSLLHLERELKKLWIPLLFLPYNSLEWFEYISKFFKIQKISAHAETWNLKSYERDKNIWKYLRSKNIEFKEYPTNGIVRKLKNRDSWNKIWHKRMKQAIYESRSNTWEINIAEEMRGVSKKCKNYYSSLFKIIASTRKLQKWGEEEGKKILQNFLAQRSRSYMYDISKPYESQKSCSRISPYITYWCLSIKYVLHKTYNRILELKTIQSSASKNHIQSLEYFLSRLHWQSHFIQKLEDEVEIEIRNLNPDFNPLRNKANFELIDAVFLAKSGIPYIDAVITELHQTWWTNFRSRAMLVSFLCNTCMQPWQAIAARLACLFTDYEPGIHYPQIQMQAATTGINTIRIYNPVYNGRQKDPTWTFIYQFLPQLRKVPETFIHEPHKWEHFETLNYPFPIIDIKEANKKAKDILWSTKRNTSLENQKKIIQKHASRTFKWDRKKSKKINNTYQWELNQTTLF